MAYRIYGTGSYRVQKAQIVSKYIGVDLAEEKVKIGVDNKAESFLAKNPLGKVPVLDTPSGPVWESNAILRYLARLRPAAHLYGHSFYDTALIDQWIDFSSFELEAGRGLWLYLIQGVITTDNAFKTISEVKKDVSKALKVLNDHLLHHTYLVGNQITLADITVATALVEMYTTLFSPKYVKQYPNVNRWFETCINQPEFAGVLGKVVYAKKEPKPPKQKKQEKPKKKDSKKGKKKDSKKGNKANKQQKKKPKNPLTLLPKSSLNLDLLKKRFHINKTSAAPEDGPSKDPWNDRRYVNTNMFKIMWEGPEGPFKWDPAGWSIWTCYDTEKVTDSFRIARTAVDSFCTRAQACRRYAWGVMMIYGESEDKNNYTLAGCWIFRGPDIINEMKAHDGFDYMKFEKRDNNDRALLESYFINSPAEIPKGQKILHRQFFK